MFKQIGLCVGLVIAAGAAQAFDRQTTNALKACHDYIWDVPEFKDLPNAAISVFPGSENGDKIVVNWNVNWDQPAVQAAGNCTVISGNVEGFEDYTK
ncbi:MULTISPECIES: hypothetical protein [Halocynthiibacter]|uniref:Uncharacterized protein n=1 Tax=Halocynthiibacter halioticoli TaxID=2986804 RepID=A0AAE3J2V8_9RHOB|nr:MULTISPECIES: hypothetical protein [Halocynthiibacter]MCV6825773.1 hypothetical protein [Halocynthiibacter halioticoli]MCW4058774.1 hypothetical protein [Halocynthiibacter sp. SDUM655004]